MHLELASVTQVSPLEVRRRTDADDVEVEVVALGDDVPVVGDTVVLTNLHGRLAAVALHRGAV